jgi:hypothetical protein
MHLKPQLPMEEGKQKLYLKLSQEAAMTNWQT